MTVVTVMFNCKKKEKDHRSQSGCEEHAGQATPTRLNREPTVAILSLDALGSECRQHAVDRRPHRTPYITPRLGREGGRGSVVRVLRLFYGCSTVILRFNDLLRDRWTRE